MQFVVLKVIIHSIMLHATSLELGTRRVRLDAAILQTDASFLSALESETVTHSMLCHLQCSLPLRVRNVLCGAKGIRLL